MMLCGRKYDTARRRWNVLLEQKQQCGILFIVSASNERHFQFFAYFVLRIQADDFRVFQTSPGEFGDGGGHCRGKQQRLTTGMSHFLEHVTHLRLEMRRGG